MGEQITEPEKTLPKKPLGWILATVIVGTFLGRLDQTIVNLAMPHMIEDFNVSITQAGWIATAYIIANAVFVPIWGKLGDSWGRKKVYILGFIGFVVGSVLAGFAWNLPSMIAFRIIQAIAGSADYPTAMAILATAYPDQKKRSQALGIWSSAFAAASVFGPLIGGPLIDIFGWRSVFLVNLPVGIIGLIMAWVYIDESTSGKWQTFDIWGATTLGAALSALVLVLEKGAGWGWTSTNSLLSFAAIFILTALFIRIEQRHPEPIVDLKFFKNPIFMSALSNNFVVFMGMMGGVFLVPVFAQTFLGLDATQTGMLFMPMAFGMMLASFVGGKLLINVNPRWVIAGSTILAGIGILLLSLLDPRSTSWAIMIPMFIMAFGMGSGMAQRTGMIAAAVPTHEIGAASSVLSLGRNIAGAFGVAIFGTLLNTFTQNALLRIAQGVEIHDPSLYGAVMQLTILKAQVNAYDKVFLIAGSILVIGGIMALFSTTPNQASKEEVVIID